MPERFKQPRQRAVMVRLFLDIGRGIAATYLDTRHFGSHCDDVMLLCAIFIGQVERRPLNASKLADFAGMPRPTVLRKLASLKKRGLVLEKRNGTFTALPAEHVNNPAMMELVEATKKSIHRASAELSKLDT